METVLQIGLGLLFCVGLVRSAAENTTNESEKRLQGIISLMQKEAETPQAPTGAINNTAEHKAMRAVLTQWADFIAVVKPGGPARPAKLRSIGAAPQRRSYDGGNNNNNNNDDDAGHENHYYSGQGYYARQGSAGTNKKKVTEQTTKRSIDAAPEDPQSQDNDDVTATSTLAPPADKPLF